MEGPDQITEQAAERTRPQSRPRRRGPPFPLADAFPRHRPYEDVAQAFDSIAWAPLIIFTCDTDFRVTQIIYSEIAAAPDRYIRVGGTDFDWLSAPDAQRVTATKRRALQSGVLVREHLSLNFEGRQREYDLIVIPDLDEHGTAHGLTCLIADITQRTHFLEAPPPRRISHAGRLLRVVNAVLFGSEGAKLRPIPAPTTPDLLDSASRDLHGPKGDVHLTRMEWRLLSYMLAHKGHVLEHETLIAEIWGADYLGENRLLHDTISRLRRRFDDTGLLHDPIETVHGVGYRLVSNGTGG